MPAREGPKLEGNPPFRDVLYLEAHNGIVGDCLRNLNLKLLQKANFPNTEPEYDNINKVSGR